MFQDVLFFFWFSKKNKQSEKDIPTWVRRLVEKEKGELVLPDTSLVKNHSILYDHFQTIMNEDETKNEDQVPSRQIYHLCFTYSSQSLLLMAWTQYYYQWMELKEMYRQHPQCDIKQDQRISLSTPVVESLLHQTMRLPPKLQRLIVTPLWISLCSADHHIYPPRSLPVFFSFFPEPIFTVYPKSRNMKLFLIGARVKRQPKRFILRDGHDREILLEACHLMKLSVVTHFKDASHFLWCFSPRGGLGDSKQDKTISFRRKIAQLLLLAHASSSPVIHVEWLWQSYSQGQILSTDPYTLTLCPELIAQGLNPKRNESPEAVSVEDEVLSNSSLWCMAKNSSSRVERWSKLYGSRYTSSSIPALLRYNQTSPEAPGLGAVISKRCKMEESTPSCAMFSKKDESPQNDLLRGLFHQQFLQQKGATLDQLLQDTPWFLCASFSPRSLEYFVSFLKKSLGVRYIFLATPLGVSLWPLIRDALIEVTEHNKPNDSRHVELIPSLEELSVAYLGDETEKPGIFCGCSFLFERTKNSIETPDYFNLLKNSTRVVFVCHQEGSETISSCHDFLDLFLNGSLHLEKKDSIEKSIDSPNDGSKKDCEPLRQMVNLLLNSLHRATPSQDDSNQLNRGKEHQGYGLSQTALTSNGTAQERSTWDVLFVSLGSSWYQFFEAEMEQRDITRQMAVVELANLEKKLPIPSCLEVNVETWHLGEILATKSTLSTQAVEFKMPSHCLRTSHRCQHHDSHLSANPFRVRYRGYSEIEEWLRLEKKTKRKFISNQLWYNLSLPFKMFQEHRTSSIFQNCVTNHNSLCPYLASIPLPLRTVPDEGKENNISTQTLAG